MYPAPPDHDPKYDIGDGRHRWCAAVMRGEPRDLRCDVISPTGHALRIIPVRELRIDDDVQFDFAYEERRARAMAINWDERLVGVLTVFPLGNGGFSTPVKMAIKLGLDRDRRRVRAVESFLAATVKGEPVPLTIQRLWANAGFTIGKGNSTRDEKGIIEAVSALEGIWARAGENGTRRTALLAANWKGEASSTNADWLTALSLLVRDGYDERLTDAAQARLFESIPALELRRARGTVAAAQQSISHTGSRHGAGPVAYAIATALRKRTGLRQRPVQRTNPKGGNAKPI
jgi:hypothetical protein